MDGQQIQVIHRPTVKVLYPANKQIRGLPPVSRLGQPPDAIKSEWRHVLDAHSRPIEKWVMAAAGGPQMIVPPRITKQLVVISCAFGNAVVQVGFSANQQPYFILPNVGTWEWILGPEECLVASTSVNTVVTGVARDV